MASEEPTKVESLEVNEPFRRQGSLRRVLPSLPSADSPLSMSAKMIDRPAVASRVNHNTYKEYQLEYLLIAEFNMLQKQDIPGVYVIPSANSPFLWYGVIFIRQGFYQGGIFRFKVLIPEEFPEGGCPRVIFDSSIFHPMINEDTGEFDVKNGFQEWKKNVNHIWQTLQYLRTSFYSKTPMSETKTPMNEQASQLLITNPKEFHQKAQLCVKESQGKLYDAPPTDDPHYIAFEPYNEEIHGPVREAIFQTKNPDFGPPSEEDDSSSLGPSWVQPGSLQPFSKPDS